MSSLIIQNAHIINRSGATLSDLLIEDGIIAKIEKNIALCCDEKSIDARNYLVFPGGIDPHVHFKLPTPAGCSVDDFWSGSRAAIAGGSTYFMDFVTPRKGESLKTALNHRLKEAEESLLDFDLHVGITWFDKSILDEMSWCVEEAGIKSFKVYLAYKGSIGLELWELEQVMQRAALLDALVLVHCE
ncbi:MAG: amidohydrolase family protein [Bacteroidota bacterium]